MLLEFVYYSLFGLNVILCLTHRKNLSVLLGTLFLLGLMFYANDATYGDHITYMADYYNGERTREGDILYGHFMILIGKLGVSYQFFLLCVYLFDLIFISLGLISFTKNPHAFIAISMFYIFPFFSMGIRYSMAMAVFLFTLRYLKERKIVLFLIGLILSSMIHICLAFSAVLLLCFIKKLTDDSNFEKTNYPYWFVFVVLAIFIINMYSSGSFMFKELSASLLTEYGLEDRGMIYLEYGIGNGNGMFLLLPEFIVSVLLSQRIVSLTKIFRLSTVECEEDFRLAKVNYLINIISSIFYLLFCITPSFFETIGYSNIYK